MFNHVYLEEFLFFLTISWPVDTMSLRTLKRAKHSLNALVENLMSSQISEDEGKV